MAFGLKFKSFRKFLILSALFGAGMFINAETTTESAALVQGYDSYSRGDWNSATFFLRKALTAQENVTAENYFMLIMSQVYSENYSSAVNDCNAFSAAFPDSNLISYVQFQKGKSLYNLGQIDGAVLALSDFCHQNPGSDLYPQALFLIANCFYADYNYEVARTFYETLLKDYPDCSVAAEAGYRIDSIDQRNREQKLLYLLKMTGEEYLSARENYEKQLRQYQTEDLVDLRRQLSVANSRIQELEKAASESLSQAQQAMALQEEAVHRAEELEAQARTQEQTSQRQQEIEELKRKALQVQMLMELNQY